jgi:Pyridoxamine 5'-phosphate oxidase
MARFYDKLVPELGDFVARQKVFFVATAPREGRVNLSPKGTDSLRVLDEHAVGYLDLTGSGAETAAHVHQDGRLTIMFCSFTAEPLILRLYGRGEIALPGSARWTQLRPRFPDLPGGRQIVLLHVESAQTSCGFGVPLFGYAGERGRLGDWAAKKGEAGLARYRSEKNRFSIDGLPTGLGED